MSWDEWKWWWGDREQILRERAEELESQINVQAARHQRVSSQLSMVQGTLEKRLDRLSAAFDAFVELSDLQTELAMHAPAAAARHRVRGLLQVLGQSPTDLGPPASAPPPPPEDVPGYWLVPAVQGLVARLANQPGPADAALAEANRRDEGRTRRFLVFVYAVLGRGHEVVDLLGVELDGIGPAGVTAEQRALWLAAADGVFGEEGHAVIVQRINDLAHRAAMHGRPGESESPAWIAGADEAALTAWLDACRGLAGPSPARSRLSRAELAGPADAGRVLRAVAVHVEAAFERDAREAAPERPSTSTADRSRVGCSLWSTRERPRKRRCCKEPASCGGSSIPPIPPI